MKLNTIVESVGQLLSAETGVPLDIVVFRGQIGQQRDAGRGIFYTTDECYAKQYADKRAQGLASSSERSGHVIKRHLRLRNPFVCGSKAEVLKWLGDSVSLKWLDVYSGEPTLYGDPRPERHIAKMMRGLGHDGVVYRDLNELVEL